MKINWLEWYNLGLKTKIDYQDELIELWSDPKYTNLRKNTQYKFLYYDPK